MNKVKSSLLAILIMLTSGLFAANVQITVRLKNGDVVTGKSTLPKINITSPYGSLSIPVEKITTLKLGILSDKSKDGAVLPDLNKLQTVKTEDEAKVIYERLLGYGTPVLSTIINFTQNPFYRISDLDNFTIEQLIEELYKVANLSSGQSVNDAITFDGANYIEGSIAFAEITVLSEYGNLTFKRDRIESLDISPIDETSGTDGNYRLKASIHITGSENNKGWLNTGVKVKSGDKLSIASSGKVILKSLSGGTYGPDGFITGTKDGAYTDDMEIKYGTVVYKIGEYGQMRLGGSKFDGSVSEEGSVYISIYETVYDKTNTGSYSVKVVKK